MNLDLPFDRESLCFCSFPIESLVFLNECSLALLHRRNGLLHYVSYWTFTSKLKPFLCQAGMSQDQYVVHSLCRGGASFPHACGASHLQIQACGGFSSLHLLPLCYSWTYTAVSDDDGPEHLLARSPLIHTPTPLLANVFSSPNKCRTCPEDLTISWLVSVFFAL